MYNLFIKLIYELDYRKFDIQELEEIKGILEEFKGKVLEVRLKHVKEENERIKEEECVSAMGEEKTDTGSRKSL